MGDGSVPGQAAELLQRYEQLQDIESRQADPEISEVLKKALGQALTTAVDKIEDLCADPEVAQLLQDTQNAHQREAEALGFLESGDLAEPDQLTEARAHVEALEEAPLYQIAKRFLGAASVSQAAPEAQKGLTTETEREALDTLLGQTPRKVAEALKGMLITSDGQRVLEIVDVQSENSVKGTEWENDPIFVAGPDRKDLYVDYSRGHLHLYIRAGSKGWVKITSARPTSGGKSFTNAKQVTEILGLDKTSTGMLGLAAGNALSIQDVQPWSRKPTA